MSDVLGSLPVEALRLDALIVESLRDVGIERIAQLATKPRGSLQTRFGSEVLLRLDQALGCGLRSASLADPTGSAALQAALSRAPQRS